jgi:crossover junction endodeoxyribonuclease RusA
MGGYMVANLEFVVSGKPPSENHMWFKAKGKHGQTMNIYKKDAKSWYNQTQNTARFVAEQANWVMPEKGQWVTVKLHFVFPNRNHPDPSNCLKAFLDALEGYLYINDKWVLPQIIGVSFDKNNPHTKVEIIA